MTRQKRPQKKKQRQRTRQQAESSRQAGASVARAQNRRVTIFMLSLLAMAVALRVSNLTAQSLWADEGNSVRLTERPLNLVIDAARADVHPPGYYVLLWFWAKLFGQSEAAMRSLSVAVGVLVVVVVWLLGRRLFDARAAWLAAFCAAVSPFQIVYSQEVRMYILVALWCIALVYVFVRWLEAAHRRPRAWWSAAYALIAAAGLWTHYSFPIVIVALDVAWLVWWLKQRGAPEWSRDGVMWLLTHAAILILYSPWLATAWARIFGYSAISASHGVTQIVAQALKLLSVGETVPNDDWSKWLTVGIVGLAVFGAWGGFAPVRPSTGGRKWLSIHTLALVLVVLAPAAMMVGLTLTGRPAYRPKFFMIASPAFCVLVGEGVALLEQGSGQTRTMGQRMWLLLGLSLVAVGSARSLHNYYANPDYARSDYRGIAELITRMGREGDAVLLDAPNQWEVFTYYFQPGPNRAPVYPLCRTRPPVEAEVVAELEEIVSGHSRLYALYWAVEQSDPQRIVERWLEAHTFKALDRWYGDVRLVIYAAPQALDEVEMAHALPDVRLGESIALRGYTLTPATVQRGDILQVTLFWQALRAPDARYKTFLHLVDADGQIVAQFDGEPGDGMRLTTQWSPGDGVFPDRYGVLVPLDVPAGVYRLLAGMYDLSGAPRLPISVDGAPAGDVLTLAEVIVQ